MTALRPALALALGIALAAGVLSARSLPAQAARVWTATLLHPGDAAASSAISGMAPGQQVGVFDDAGPTRAALWSGTAASYVDLHPTGVGASFARATSGGQQAGIVLIESLSQAAIWNGTAASYVNLHPDGEPFLATQSNANATNGAQQAGFATIGGSQHAGIWSGTPESFVDLHPAAAGATSSSLNATTGAQQAGFATIGGSQHAGIWSGTPESFVDLHRAAGATSSFAFATTGSQQAGYATIGGSQNAGVWSGTAESFVDLHPAVAGFTDSALRATTGTHQAGIITNTDDVIHAGVWAGTPESFVDLHAFLPPGYTSSEATAIWTDGPLIYVAGSAFQPDSESFSRSDAILWKFDLAPTPTPTPTPTPPPPASAPTFTVLAKSTRPTTQARITLRGSVTDPDGGAPRVFVKVGPRKFRPARLAGSTWRFTASLAPGKNRVLLYAQDSSGLRSPTRKLSLTRRP